MFRGGAQLTIAKVKDLGEGRYVFNTVKFEDIYLTDGGYSHNDTVDGGIFEGALWERIPDPSIKDAEEVFDRLVKDKRIAELEQQVKNLQAAIAIIEASKPEVEPAQTIQLNFPTENSVPVEEVRS